MNKKILLQRDAFEGMLKNLVELDEGYKEIINDYYPQHTEERINIMKLFSEYFDKLNLALKNVIVEENSKNYFPFVIVGCDVEILDIDYNETCCYRIVRPAEMDIEKNHISFLSPIGIALLLKKDGDTVSVNTPGGIVNYKVKSIRVGTVQE